MEDNSSSSSQWKDSLLCECSNFILDSACGKLLLCYEYLVEYFRGCSVADFFWGFEVLKRFALGSRQLRMCFLFLWFSRSLGFYFSSPTLCFLSLTCFLAYLLFISFQTLLYPSTGSEELKRMAHSKARAADGKVTYPPGVKEISDKISKEEMVRRLKVSVFLSFCQNLFIVWLHRLGGIVRFLSYSCWHYVISIPF